MKDVFCQLSGAQVAADAEHGVHLMKLNSMSVVGNRLLQHVFGITKAAGGNPGDEPQDFRFGVNIFFAADKVELFNNRSLGEAVEIKALAA